MNGRNNQIHKRYDRDIEYFYSLFNSTTNDINELVKEEADKLEYDGSIMFDANPDKQQLDNIIDRIIDRYDNECKEWIRAIAQVLLFNEMTRRRQRRYEYQMNGRL